MSRSFLSNSALHSFFLLALFLQVFNSLTVGIATNSTVRRPLIVLCMCTMLDQTEDEGTTTNI
jgi:hypothetical protein